MKKLFKFNPVAVAGVSDVAIEVTGIYELRRLVAFKIPRAINIRILRSVAAADNLPFDWLGDCHYVLADFDDWHGRCVGVCNFYERITF